MKTRVVVSGVAVLLISCALPPSPKLERIGADTPLVQKNQVVIQSLDRAPFTVAEKRNSVQAHKAITFDLTEIPKSARLEAAMTVVMYACAAKPGLPQGQTHVLINQHQVAYWSFSHSDNGNSYRTAIDIDPKILRVGQNKLEVVGYRCSYGNFEVVRFNAIGLAIPTV